MQRSRVRPPLAPLNYIKYNLYTDLAHLGERISYKDKVEGSSPSIGTGGGLANTPPSNSNQVDVPWQLTLSCDYRNISQFGRRRHLGCRSCEFESRYSD